MGRFDEILGGIGEAAVGQGMACSRGVSVRSSRIGDY